MRLTSPKIRVGQAGDGREPPFQSLSTGWRSPGSSMAGWEWPLSLSLFVLLSLWLTRRGPPLGRGSLLSSQSTNSNANLIQKCTRDTPRKMSDEMSGHPVAQSS